MPDAPDVTDTRRASTDVPAVGEVTHRSLSAAIATTDDGQRSTFTIMTGDLARDGWIVDPDGAEFDRYLRNPVVLWQHGYTVERGFLPIGRGSNITRTADGWSADVEYEEDDFAAGVAGMVKRGTLSAVSIGWRTLEAGWEMRDGRDVYVIRRWELTEFSVVAVPADANALVSARAAGDTRHAAEVARLEARVAELEARTAGTVLDATLDETTPPAEAERAAPPVLSPRAATPEETEALALVLAEQIHTTTLRALGRA